MILKPQPNVIEMSRPFWDGCNNDKLVIQHCTNCDKWVFYPRGACPCCHHDTLEWKEVTGHGKVITNTTVRRTHHDGFNADAPYVFAAVELDEGPCLYGQLFDVPFDCSLIGKPVKTVFIEHGPDRKIAAFQPQ